MKIYYLMYICVVSYSGGNFFTPMETLPPNTCAGASVLSPPFDALTTQFFFDENTHPSQLPEQPLPQAHAHNDYEHGRPLLDALEQGFTYIEADVHLVNGELYVSHDHPLFLKKERTLCSLYLDPLKKIAEHNRGNIYPKNARPLHLMIDIKTEALETYQVLKTCLAPYQYLLTTFENGIKTERAVTVFLSGNRPVERILAEQKTLMCLDGRIEDLGKAIPPDLMPMVSERFSNVFGWEIFGQQKNESQWLVLKRLSRLAHAEGKKLRLWASPEEEEIWEKLLAAGCDVINTDELVRLRSFLQRREMAFLSDIKD